ncbi:hypothetical protein B9Z65_4110 [Elsinoe australis]|uniref:SnoaL-like domain-containing protein n=1 Tax=Elsinoe australis TaxID=40998 RepID=A0A2P7Z1W0_9PEZI|nr:hypothetical protein B9Z65_4110 [Elsinoe australis]
MSSLETNMRTTTEAFLYSFRGDWQPTATLSLRSADCKHTFLPASLGNAPKSKDEWAAYFKNVAPLIKGAKMTINDYLPAPSERRAVCRSSMVASTPVGEFRNEYVWFFTFDESGEHVTDIVEFLDSVATRDIRSRLGEAGLLGRH